MSTPNLAEWILIKLIRKFGVLVEHRKVQCPCKGARLTAGSKTKGHRSMADWFHARWLGLGAEWYECGEMADYLSSPLPSAKNAKGWPLTATRIKRPVCTCEGEKGHRLL